MRGHVFWTQEVDGAESASPHQTPVGGHLGVLSRASLKVTPRSAIIFNNVLLGGDHDTCFRIMFRTGLSHRQSIKCPHVKSVTTSV